MHSHNFFTNNIADTTIFLNQQIYAIFVSGITNLPQKHSNLQFLGDLFNSDLL